MRYTRCYCITVLSVQRLSMILHKVTDTINELVKNRNHSGCMLLSTDKEIIYKECFGFADITKKIPISFKTQFLAGSVTKQFAAVAILKALFDKHKTNIKSELNKSIENYLPAEHEIWDSAMPSWARKVTIHQLLVHSSGITNYTSLPEFENQTFKNRSDLINFFKGKELEFIPGEKFSYSNSGYYLLGLIIEEITQEKLDVYLEKNFFEPLTMQSTFFPMRDTVDELIRTDYRFKNLARGYQYEVTTHNANLAEIKQYERMDVPGAGGSLITTAEDLLKWNNALYSRKIIPEFLLELMLHPYLVTEREDAYYGYGIEIIRSKALDTYYSHRGGIPGFRSILTYIPSLKLSIIILQNIVANQEKIMPEVKQLLENFPPHLSQEESAKQLTDIIETQYPGIIENRKRFEFSDIYEKIISLIQNT